LLAALSVLIITITEMDVLKKSPENLLLTDFYRSTIWVWTIGFSVFSLILTFAREIIKDMEDMTGDAAFDCFSIPIVYGLKKTKIIVSSLLIITQILLLVAGLFLIDIQSLASLIFIILFLILPLIFLTVYLNRASEIQQFKFVAGLLKIIMLSGVLYAVVFSFCLADEKVFSLFGLLFN
jgi:4-hydroxybenzoate polyprenyltransferase